MRALDKDRNRRYDSASALALDVQRYLDDEAVEACPPSKAYQLQKFTKRNKAFFITVAIVLIALVAGTGIASWQAVVANEERAQAKLAEEKAIESEAIAVKEKQKAIENLNLAIAENQRAEEYMQTAFEALDQVYQVALGGDRMIGGSGGIWDTYNYRTLSVKETELLETALELYKHLANSGSKNPEAIYRNALAFQQIGALHRSQGNREEAVEAFRQAIERIEHLTANGLGTAEQFMTLGNLYRHLGNVTINLKLDPSILHAKGRLAVERSFEMNPNSFDALFYLANEYRSQGDYTSAKTMVEKALRIDPNDGGGYYRAAELFRRTEEGKLALQYAREAVRLDPTNAPFVAKLRMCLESENELEEADKVNLQLQKIAPRYFGVYTYLTIRHISKGEYQKALVAANTAVELNPVHAWCYDVRAYANKKNGNLEQALSDYSKACELTHNASPDLIRKRADMLVLLGRESEALELVKEDLEPLILNAASDERMVEALRSRGSFYKSLGKSELAIADFSRAIELKPEQSSYYRDRGDYYREQDKYKLALADLNKAIELLTDDGDLEAYISRAALFVNMEQFDKAITDYEKYVELSSNSLSNYTSYQGALFSIAGNDMLRYQELCQKMLINFADLDEALATHFTAWACALAPNAIEDYTSAIQLARHAVEQEPDNQQHLNGLGAILMRSGQYDAAKVELEMALAAGESDNTSSNYIRYFLAMTEHHLERKQAAEDQLLTANTEATKELEDTEKPPAWNRKLTLELLRKEAEVLIQVTSSQSEDEK